MATSKKVTIGARPASKASAEDWVGSRKVAAEAEPTKRLTLDIPLELHGRIKSVCALKNQKMVEAITALLEKAYPPAK